jgi:hypothetical protein
MKYKLVAVTNSGTETTLELSGEEFNTLLNAWQVYENFLVDSEPLEDMPDFEEWETERAEFDFLDTRLTQLALS